MRTNSTKRKFLSLPPGQQHKKCAEFLRVAYEELLEGKSSESSLDSYLEIASWLQIPILTEISLKTFSDRYHEHLKHAEIRHKEHHLLPIVRKGDRVHAETPHSIDIYFDNIRSAHNVGSMLRTIEAFSLGKAYFSESTPKASHKQVKDTAMGAEQWVECSQGFPVDTLRTPIIALETAEEAISLFDFKFPNSFTLVIGNEEYGCSDHTLQIADFLIEIPLRGHKNSLNVANAFAITAAEIIRQKRECSKQNTPIKKESHV